MTRPDWKRQHLRQAKDGVTQAQRQSTGCLRYCRAVDMACMAAAAMGTLEWVLAWEAKCMSGNATSSVQSQPRTQSVRGEQLDIYKAWAENLLGRILAQQCNGL